MKRLSILFIALLLTGCVITSVADVWQVKVNSHTWGGPVYETENYVWLGLNVTVTNLSKNTQYLTEDVGTFYVVDGDYMYSWSPNEKPSNVPGNYSGGQSRTGSIWFPVPIGFEPEVLFLQQEGKGSVKFPIN